jgi:hypothetical protein
VHALLRCTTTHMCLYLFCCGTNCCRSSQLEEAQLCATLGVVLAAQARLVLARTALFLSSRFIDYGGLLVNYCCIAAAVYGAGGWQQQAGGSSGGGALASRVAVASFYLLTLINSLTQARAAKLAAHTHSSI